MLNIILSHSRIFEDAQKAATVTEETVKQLLAEEKTKENKKSERKKVESAQQWKKTTLGDISGLAALKEEMDKKKRKKKDKRQRISYLSLYN